MSGCQPHHELASCIQAITYRKVLEDDRKGKQRIELEHEAEWRFLFLHGTFRTRLQCLQDRRAGTASPSHAFLIMAGWREAVLT